MAHHSISRHSLAIAVLAVSLAGCASPDFPEQVERPADKLYDEALSLVLQGDAEKAAPQFEEVERQHPYSDLAVRAQIMAAWSFYHDNNYPRAVAALDRFIAVSYTHLTLPTIAEV